VLTRGGRPFLFHLTESESIMSVFTSRVTDTRPIPHDPDQSVTIRKLAPRHLEAAAKASQLQSIADLKEIGGPAFLKELEALGDGDKKKAEDKAAEAAKRDPLLTYDPYVLIAKGLKEWTYDAPLVAESFEDLDDVTRDFIAREILRLSKPALFQTEAEQKADQKND
jgi:hypothetical protein